jgi:hypothetical protein
MDTRLPGEVFGAPRRENWRHVSYVEVLGSKLGWLGLSGALSLLACSSVEDRGATSRAAHAARADASAEAGAEAGSGLPDVTFSLDGHVDAGGEVQSCLYVRMPTDRGEIAVPSAESHYTPGSHHFLVFRTKFTDLPDGGGAVHDCSVNDLLLNVTGTYYEAQAPEARRDLPRGVAHVFQPGEVLLLTAHYLNVTQDDLDTHVDFRLHTIPREKVEAEAGSIFFYNYVISVPPFSDVTVTRDCPIPKDINLALLWSHMHSRGVAFEATTSDAEAKARVGALYATKDWSEPTPRAFDTSPPVTIHAGEKITYSCDYHNPTANTYVQGPSAATNEMCILHGMYWPRLDPTTELCLAGSLPGDGGTTADAH